MLAELGVGIALVATAAADSGRPLRDILIGLVVGVALGVSLVTPVDQSALRAAAAAGGRHGRRRRDRPVIPQPADAAAQAAQAAHRPAIVQFTATPWPHPELTEQPRPTFDPPGR
ncbi:MAG: hypothetical protein QOI15_1834 [Pseudonocardiales bacterium]|nr:hypothetical protein [Pseudonocardiales bacterium]MDT4942813.1 hypothetical protein [Pseudonocardiales bacterium]